MLHCKHFLPFSTQLLSIVVHCQNFSVGIIGAGISGLYSALILQSLDIDFEILEANDRPGGRISTYYFDPESWKTSRPGEPEYYDYFVSRNQRLTAFDMQLTINLGRRGNADSGDSIHEKTYW